MERLSSKCWAVTTIAGSALKSADAGDEGAAGAVAGVWPEAAELSMSTAVAAATAEAG
jgi:hypothetical protein